MTKFASSHRLSGAHWLRPTIAGGLMALAALFAALDVEAASGKTAENSGTVCFERGERPGGPEIKGTYVTFIPFLGCLSSSCTEVVESRFEVDAADGEISMTSRFTVRGEEGRRICSADCMGGGRAFRDVETITDGIHRVTVGGVEIGTLDTAELDAKENGAICFSTPRPNDVHRKPKG